MISHENSEPANADAFTPGFIMKNRRSGFTLIEILISLTLLTIVLGAVYGSFFSVQRALDRFDSVSLKYHETRTALDIMRREVESALVKNPRSDDVEKIKLEFVIKDRDIFGRNTSSLSLASFSYRGSGLNAVSYFVKENNGKLNLLKSESPVSSLSSNIEIEVIEGIDSFTVETMFRNKWVRTWDTADTGALPKIVRLSIEFDDNGKPVTMTEYAKPKMGTRL